VTMNPYAELLDRLERVGWTAERLSQPEPLPEQILERYPDIPAEYREFAESAGFVVGPGETAWLVTSCVFAGTSKCAWAYNEWERQSLEAAGNDQALAKEIRAFWDRHLPVVMSTKSCYAYFALDLDTQQIVQGEEPMYEDVGSPLAGSLDEMFRLIVTRDDRVSLYV
jgi:hypothetical protein